MATEVCLYKISLSKLTKMTFRNTCLTLDQGRPTFFIAQGHPLMWAGSRAARAKLTLPGIPNRINYCEIFYNIYIIYNYGRGSHNTVWWASGWRFLRYTENKRIVTAGNTDLRKCMDARCLAEWLRISVQTLRDTVVKYKSLVVRTHEFVK
jgi:hypothetical protein